MSENYDSILDAARRLPAEEQRRLAERLLAAVNQPDSNAAAGRGKARRHFGVWESVDKRSADNDRIDLDLAREYGGSRQP
ncbi:MAG: hypothetical protein M3416_09835 [Acidobacteriota bacterium]|nr:hypothetical protein [Acidobacteriota bacterium]